MPKTPSLWPEVWKSLKEKMKESLISVLPVTLLVFLLSVTPWVDISAKELTVFAGAAILLIAGISLFNLGADMAMTPMGQHIGEGLTRSRKLGILLTVCFLMGVLITIAEPDLSVLADQVSAVMYSLDYRNGWVEVWLVEQGMTVLDLVLTYKWYDMIESGEKREEYRAITPYWRKRIQSGKRYTHVRFHRGYTAKSMVFRFDGLRIGNGNTQWGAPADRDVFIISLGEKYK